MAADGAVSARAGSPATRGGRKTGQRCTCLLLTQSGHRVVPHSQTGMSALPPKADIEWPSRSVRKVPIADSCTAANQHRYSINSSARARLVPIQTWSPA